MTTKNSTGPNQQKIIKPLNLHEMTTIPVIIGVIAFVLAKLLSFLF